MAAIGLLLLQFFHLKQQQQQQQLKQTGQHHFVHVHVAGLQAKYPMAAVMAQSQKFVKKKWVWKAPSRCYTWINRVVKILGCNECESPDNAGVKMWCEFHTWIVMNCFDEQNEKTKTKDSCNKRKFGLETECDCSRTRGNADASLNLRPSVITHVHCSSDKMYQWTHLSAFHGEWDRRREQFWFQLVECLKQVQLQDLTMKVTRAQWTKSTKS